MFYIFNHGLRLCDCMWSCSAGHFFSVSQPIPVWNTLFDCLGNPTLSGAIQVSLLDLVVLHCVVLCYRTCRLTMARHRRRTSSSVSLHCFVRGFPTSRVLASPFTVSLDLDGQSGFICRRRCGFHPHHRGL